MTGIGGNYKVTCENVMTVLRDNKDSLMAVLEAFVYDPLLNWRLMDGRFFTSITCLSATVLELKICIPNYALKLGFSGLK